MTSDKGPGGAGSASWSGTERVTRALLRAFAAASMRLCVEGLERVPDAGPVIVASNHLHLLDYPLLMSMAPRPTACLISRRWVQMFGVGPLLRHGFRVIGVDIGGRIHKTAVVQGLKVLRSGGILGITPEGDISHTGALREGFAGVAYLALRAGVPVLPMVVYGQERARAHWKRFRRAPVTARFGMPLKLAQSEDMREDIRAGTLQVMNAIASLLPDEYRGEYAEGGAQG